MSAQISTNYRKLSPGELEALAVQLRDAWQDADIPARQYGLVVKAELDKWRNGESVAPFDALVKCINRLPIGFLVSRPRLLDVGASSGYYSEVLKRSGFLFQYTGTDYSEAFKAMAERLHPDIAFDVADATALPYVDTSFDIVLHSAVLMHVADYEKAIAEAARVARRYVLFHRTPIVIDRPTEYFEKEAYGVRCLEIHFNERELLDTFAKYGLTLMHSENIFWNTQEGMGHWAYLFSKQQPAELEWERA